MAVLENGDIQLFTSRENGSFQILPSQSSSPNITNNRMGVQYAVEGGESIYEKILLFCSDVPESHLSESSKRLTFHGEIQTVSLSWCVELEVQNEPGTVKWRISFQNDGVEPLCLDRIDLITPDLSNQSNLVFPSNPPKEQISFFSNGWQSWSYTSSYRATEKMKRTRLGPLQKPMVYNHGTPLFYEEGQFSSDFFGVVCDLTTLKGLLFGFLSQKQHFGTITVDFRDINRLEAWANGDHARLDPGKSITTDWLTCCLIDLQDPFPLDPYFDKVAMEHGIRSMGDIPSGWCSWYYYFQKISEKIIKDNVDHLDKISQSFPLDVIQIDDGYQKEVGDWLETNDRFLDCMAEMSSYIREKGFVPGIWMAPFILHPRSDFATNHPELLLRKKNGKKVRCGFVWNTLGAALDLSNQEALEYACAVINAASNEWGFRYLKLDFLYAAALEGRFHDPTKSRAQVLRNGLEAIRCAAGDQTKLVGCGVPLASAIGLVEMMRVGADVGPDWSPAFHDFKFPFKNEPHIPAARNAIQNSITRSAMHKKWWINDPDCLLVRENSNLTLTEVQTLASVIGMSGGSVFISDAMPSLSEERKAIIQKLLPPIGKRPRVLDLFHSNMPSHMRLDLKSGVGEWFLISYSNWEDHSRIAALETEVFDLPPGEYYVCDFWKQKISKNQENEGILFCGELAAHGTKMLAVRKRNRNWYQYIGSSLHASQGLEVTQIQVCNDELIIDFKPGYVCAGNVFSYLDRMPASADFNGKQVDIQLILEHVYQFIISDMNTGRLSISFA